ncbi:MAG: outer membrane lipoprotein carrier protein LolA [Deltaproteobacteria bacterium]|nr:outer membrane lipoprotein carrier protein LolA [Deltaproteobacteria bacterium]
MCRRANVVLAWLLLAALPALGGSAAGTTDLDRILQRFAEMPGFSAHFQEERRLALLQAPLRSEGAIYFQPPDRLARHVERPAPSATIVRGNEITVVDGGDLRSLDLAAAPVLSAFVEGLRLLLRGDAGGIRTLFSVELATEANGAWKLRLTPRRDAVRAAILSIVVSGQDVRPGEMRIFERGGDETRIRFSRVDVAHRFDAAESERLFRAPPP